MGVLVLVCTLCGVRASLGTACGVRGGWVAAPCIVQSEGPGGWVLCGKVGGHIVLKVFVFSFPGGWLPWRGGRLRVTHYCALMLLCWPTLNNNSHQRFGPNLVFHGHQQVIITGWLFVTPASTMSMGPTLNSPVGWQLTSCAVLACICLSLLMHNSVLAEAPHNSSLSYFTHEHKQ